MSRTSIAPYSTTTSTDGIFDISLIPDTTQKPIGETLSTLLKRNTDVTTAKLLTSTTNATTDFTTDTKVVYTSDEVDTPIMNTSYTINNFSSSPTEASSEIENSTTKHFTTSGKQSSQTMNEVLTTNVQLSTEEATEKLSSTPTYTSVSATFSTDDIVAPDSSSTLTTDIELRQHTATLGYTHVNTVSVNTTTNSNPHILGSTSTTELLNKSDVTTSRQERDATTDLSSTFLYTTEESDLPTTTPFDTNEAPRNDLTSLPTSTQSALGIRTTTFSKLTPYHSIEITKANTDINSEKISTAVPRNASTTTSSNLIIETGSSKSQTEKSKETRNELDVAVTEPVSVTLQQSSRFTATVTEVGLTTSSVQELTQFSSAISSKTTQSEASSTTAISSSTKRSNKTIAITAPVSRSSISTSSPATTNATTATVSRSSISASSEISKNATASTIIIPPSAETITETSSFFTAFTTPVSRSSISTSSPATTNATTATVSRSSISISSVVTKNVTEPTNVSPSSIETITKTPSFLRSTSEGVRETVLTTANTRESSGSTSSLSASMATSTLRSVTSRNPGKNLDNFDAKYPFHKN